MGYETRTTGSGATPTPTPRSPPNRPLPLPGALPALAAAAPQRRRPHLEGGKRDMRRKISAHPLRCFASLCHTETGAIPPIFRGKRRFNDWKRTSKSQVAQRIID